MSIRHRAAQKTIAIIPLVMRNLAAHLRQHENQPLHTHLAVMASLAQFPACNLRQLAEQHAVSPPSMSNTVSKLVDRGWVERTQSSDDRRMIHIRLTPAGWVLLQQAEETAVAHIATLLTRLSAEEQSTVLAGLSNLEKAFTTAPAPKGEKRYP